MPPVMHPRSGDRLAIVRRSYGAARAGTVLVAVLCALVLLQLAFVGVALLAVRDSDLSSLRLQQTRAQYAADAGANMALNEIYANADLDVDGTIGTISGDGIALNDPTLNQAQVTVVSIAAASGRKFSVQARCGSTQCKRELWVDTAAAWKDGFELYTPGQALNNVGGWVPWDGAAGAVGYGSNAVSRMGFMSQDIRSGSDSVHTYTATSGKWVYTAWQYVPTAAKGETYFILMNTYKSGGSKGWSTQIRFDLNTGKLYDNMSGGVTGNQLTIIRNQWVPLVVNIDLDAGTQSVTYNGSLLFSASWNRQGGPKAFAAVDLYGAGTSHIYYDDISLLRAGVTSTALLQWSAVAASP